ncbi:MAG: hypothetical protein CMF71_09545 [Magnetovibrio sp.]|nr:hypothetical protein [Magnetovibrio sp.]
MPGKSSETLNEIENFFRGNKTVKNLSMLIAGFALFFVSITGCANADTRSPTILIMAEDGDRESLPRNSRISTRILNELVTQLNYNGYDVYDETAITLRTHSKGRIRRTDAELIDIAKSIKSPPIDVVGFFEVFANLDRKSYQNELRLRTVGRLLSVADGRRLGNWEAKLPNHRDHVWLLPNSCFPNDKGVNRDCLLEAVGNDARILAQEVGSLISEKLAAQLVAANGDGMTSEKEGLKRGLTLVFDGFTSGDYQDIEEYLVVFSGYADHRLVRSSHLYTEVWYETTIEARKLERNIHKMMDILGWPYILNFSGNNYTIKAKNLRQGRSSPAKSKPNYKW